MQYMRVMADVDAAFATVADRFPDHPCRPGCDACCHGPFDIGPADAWLLIEGVAALPDRTRRQVMHAIAAAAAETRAAVGVAPGEPVSVELLGDERFDALCDELADRPCPMLVAGECAAYENRPQPCRMVGAVYRSDTRSLDFDCPIGLTDAAPAVELDLAGTEARIARIEERLELPVIGRDRTTIALALDAILGASSDSDR